jgi:hypothetical protein
MVEHLLLPFARLIIHQLMFLMHLSALPIPLQEEQSQFYYQQQ